MRTRVSEAAMRVMGNVIAACECKEETVKFQTYAANSFPVRDIEMLRKWNVRVPRLHCTDSKGHYVIHDAIAEL